MLKETFPIWKISSQPCFSRTFSNCLSHNSPAKGRPYRFRSRGTIGSSILDHDLGHLCRGRRIQMSGHSDFVFFPFLLGCKKILCPLHALRNLEIWRWYPWLLLPSFVMLMILVQWILHETLNRLLQYDHGGQLDPCIFWCFASNLAFFRWHVSISEAKWTFSPIVIASSVDHLFSLLICQVPRLNLFKFLPFFDHCCFRCMNFHGLRHRDKFVNQIKML